jgi:ABC-type glycerol-3-phosphate transport system permease component
VKRRVVYYSIISAIAIIWLFPIAWFFLQSIRFENDIFAIPPVLIANNYTLEHFVNLFDEFSFATALFHSIVVVVGTMAVTLVLAVLAGYGLSRYRFRFSNWILVGVVGCRMIAPPALLIPLYNLLESVNLIDTPVAIMIGHLTLALPLAILLLKSFFDELPVEIEQAAMMDGMSTLQIITKVIVPISTPGIAVSMIFTYIVSWMDFMFAVSLATSYHVASTALAGMMSTYKIYWGEIAAGGIVYSILPIVIVLLLQKYIVKGVLAGAIK